MRKLFIGIGAGPGLGASTAERFAREGFDILLTARNKNRVLELADAIARKLALTQLHLNWMPPILSDCGIYRKIRIVCGRCSFQRRWNEQSCLAGYAR